MDDIEKELIAAGARWREAVETTEQARPEPRVRGTVRTRLTHETAVLWGVLGVLAGIVALQMLGAGAGPRPLAIGARVRGEGSIVSRGGNVSLCVLALGRLEPGAPPVCSNIAVTLVGLARADMPQVEEANGVAFIRWAEVTGTWTSKGIRVDGVEPREHPGPALPTSPCAATSAMPSASDRPPIDIERDLAALAEHVAGAPNR